MFKRKTTGLVGGALLLVFSTPVIASAVRATPPAPAAPVAPLVQKLAHDGDSEPVSTPQRPMILAVGSADHHSVVVNDKGRTLYHFSLDKPGRSACRGTCEESFLPVRSLGGKPATRGTLAMAKVGSIILPDGSYQVTFASLPLYEYKGDEKPGDAKAAGVKAFGGTWTMASPGGKK